MLAEHWEQALEVLADMAWASAIDPDELDREKPVVIEEIRGYDDEPESNAVDLYVHYLRRKLGDAVQITTVRGVGYRLDPPDGGSTPDQPSEGA